MGENFYLFLFFFWKSFENEEKYHNFTSAPLKYKKSLIWIKNVHMCQFSLNGRLIRGGQKLHFFSFFWKVFENKKQQKDIIFSLQDN